jgi:hypothetical protein
MAERQLGMLGEMHDYFSNVKTEFQERLQSWSGVGGLRNNKILEKELKDLGCLHDTDASVAVDNFNSVEQGYSRVSQRGIGKESVDGGAMQGVE